MPATASSGYTLLPMTQVLGALLRRGRWSLLLSLAAAFGLQGCAEVQQRHEADSARSQSAATRLVSDSVTIRVLDTNGQFKSISAADLAQRMPMSSSGRAQILALSGGGAGGAFGAGALVGLTRSGSRPIFDIVTGVSVGAFIAPFAYLGPAWDAKLSASYDGKESQRLLKPVGPGAVFGSSLFQGAPLRKLVDHFVSETMVQAVASEARKGRLLLVATTDLDREVPTVWDLGSIAMNGGSDAVTLFQDILVASASVPGIFPPVMLKISEAGISHTEMHVDGGVTVPFFIFPNLAEVPVAQLGRLQGAHVYVLVDGLLAAPPHATSIRTAAILSRTVDAAMLRMLKANLELAAATTALHSMTLDLSGVPISYPFGGALDFQAEMERPLFDYAERCAATQRIWEGQETPRTPDPSPRSDMLEPAGCPGGTG